jgi:trk system potassium uptake protein
MAIRKMLSPGRTILLSIFITICLGTLFLMLPVAQARPIPFVDCLFTATSATCVTGVLTVPFDSFTLFGKIIILILIQIGGIGLLTLTLFLASLFLNLGLATQLMVGQILELETWKATKRMLFFIISLTLLVELIGALVIYIIIAPHYTPSQAIFHAIFHSISSFCSAGLSSFNNNMIGYQHNIPMLAVTASLILFGTLGFITWYELFIYLRKHIIQHKRFMPSLTTRVVLHMSVLLITGITFLFIILEGPSHFANAPWWVTVANMLFNGIAYRSTGFTSIDLNTMQTATVFLIIMYSFIGSAPLSTGGGIKVTTFTLFLATIRSVIKGRMTVDLKGRKIPQDQIFKAIAILSLSLCWIVVSTFCLSLLEKHTTFITVFFETVSSFTTLGLATDITPYLSIPGKILITLNMFIGRVGSLTLLLALRARPDRLEFQYPEERLMIS